MIRRYSLLLLAICFLSGCSGEPTPNRSAKETAKKAKVKIRAEIAALDRAVEAIPQKYKSTKKITLIHEKTSKHEQADNQVRSDFQLRLINPCQDEVKFHGYTESSPIYRIQFKMKDGTWDETGLGWCGTGMRDCFVLRGESSTFSVSTYEKSKSMKIGLRIDGDKTVWSEEIEL